jgi:ADP-ribose pyrophosphatase YjhB (NUDIX family)
MEEYLDVYDDSKKNTGIVIPRSKEKELLDGQHILVTTIIILNSDSKIMMQLTSKSKKNVLAIPGGHVLHNESSKDAIVRELFEEQGILVDKNAITLVEERLSSQIVFSDIYYLKADYKKEDMVLQIEEVEDIVWMSPDEIFKASDEGKVRKSSIDSIRNFINSKYNTI